MASIKTLNDFYSQLKTVGIRLKNQFQLTVTTGNGELDTIFQDLILYAESAQLPGRTQNVAELPYMGYTFQVPTNMTMTQELTMTVRSDSNMRIRNAFLKWASLISNPDIINGSNAQGDKRIPANGNVRLHLMDAQFENVIADYHLYGCFPKSVGTMELSNSDTGVATFETTLQFQFWRLENDTVGDISDIA